jgi:uncharacterized protein (UPF0332 family)
MSEKLLDLAFYRIGKAKDDLESAQVLFESGKYSQSTNRSYYSIFHATRAILALDKFDSKKHSGVIAFFISNYIRLGKIDEKYSKIITNAEKIRLASDYNDFYIADKDTAERQLVNAQAFLTMAEDVIKKRKAEFDSGIEG